MDHTPEHTQGWQACQKYTYTYFLNAQLDPLDNKPLGHAFGAYAAANAIVVIASTHSQNIPEPL
jgi:hypothetical protein